MHPFVSGTVEQHPELILVRKNPEDKLNFGGTWHSDVTFEEMARPWVSILYAKQVPEYGGDTLFANMYLAYENALRCDEANDRRFACSAQR